LRQRLGGRTAEGGDDGGTGDDAAAGGSVGDWGYRFWRQIRFT